MGSESTFSRSGFRAADEELDDLRERLARTRFAPPAPRDTWDHGVPESYLRSMVAAWQDFDWRVVEGRINGYRNYLAEIDGQPVHFIHVRARPRAQPRSRSRTPTPARCWTWVSSHPVAA